MKTKYEIIYVNEGRKNLLNKVVKSLREVETLLLVGERVTAKWIINQTACIGYREFEKTKKGLSYSRYPMYEY
jgi:hypothetical protein